MKDLIRTLTKRRNSLAFLLKDNADEYPADRQHQIYGAIMELDYVLSCLNEHAAKLVDEREFELVRLQPNVGMAARVLGIFRT